MRVIEFGSEFDWDSNLPFLKNADKEYFNVNNLKKYRSGRDALKAVAKFYQTRIKTVLLPALCCESMVSPFVMNGYKLVFYKINANYTANSEDVESKLERNCLFLYMPYFGVKPFEDVLLRRWKEEFGIICIEDRTQNALHKNQTAFVADVVISSIRKWLAIPDGGFLWSKENIENATPIASIFADIRANAMKKKSLYLSTGKEELKTAYREMLQMAAESLDENSDFHSISPQSEALLNRIDFAKILLLRQKNVKDLKSLLNNLAVKGKIAYITQNPEDSTLYFPILVKNRDKLQKQLAEKKIYCPVIWPIPKEARNVCRVAEYTAENMLALPCDQRYDAKDMEYIATALMQLLD